MVYKGSIAMLEVAAKQQHRILEWATDGNVEFVVGLDAAFFVTPLY